MVRRVSKDLAKPICVLDLQGPKIRTGKLEGGEPVDAEGGRYLIIARRRWRNPARASTSTTFTTLAENLERGSRILLSDGLIELRVTEIRGADVVCEIINGGLLGEKKGINLPGIR